MFDVGLACVEFCLEQQVDWCCVDLKYPLFLFLWRTEVVIDLAEKPVQQREQEVGDPFVDHEHRICPLQFLSNLMLV